MKIKFSICLIAFAGIFLLPFSAFACACCADFGEYSVWSGKPGEHEFRILEGIDFAKEGDLFVNAAGTENLLGLDSLKKGSDQIDEWTFKIEDLFAAGSWNLDFVSGSGKSGGFRLPLPAKMTIFKIDIHDREMSVGGPLLYKEWRFNGIVQSGSGFFKTGIVNPTSYFLVLQGRGNGCDNIEDFTHWRLEITGKKAKYAFFGKLDSGEISLLDEKHSASQ